MVHTQDELRGVLVQLNDPNKANLRSTAQSRMNLCNHRVIHCEPKLLPSKQSEAELKLSCEGHDLNRIQHNFLWELKLTYDCFFERLYNYMFPKTKTQGPSSYSSFASALLVKSKT